MEALKRKLFDVLMYKMSVSDFEQLLYKELSAKESLIKDELFYNLVCTNYKKKDALEQIKQIVINHLSEEEVILFYIESFCVYSLKDPTIADLEKHINRLTKFMDFQQNEYPILWDFYHLESDIDLSKFGYYDEDEIFHLTFALAESIESALSECETQLEKLDVLNCQFYYDKRTAFDVSDLKETTWFGKLKRWLGSK